MSRRAKTVEPGSVGFTDEWAGVLQTRVDRVTGGVATVHQNGKLLAFNSTATRTLRRDLAQTTRYVGPLRRLAARNQSRLEAERARIARDIHDELGQLLTALKMNLFHLAKGLNGKMDRQKLALDIREMIGLVDSTSNSVRRISADLRPSLLDDLGIAAAIEWQLQEFQLRTRIRGVIRRPDHGVPLEQDGATAVFRIFQEILTNIARHANASVVRVGIKQENGHLLLNVRDNGKGITQEEIAAPGSLGLLGMRERALHLSGELLVRGVRGKGTLVSLRIPIARRKGSSDESVDRGRPRRSAKGPGEDSCRGLQQRRFRRGRGSPRGARTPQA